MVVVFDYLISYFIQVAHKARTRLSTLAAVNEKDRRKQKNASIKRRPTILRHTDQSQYKEVDIVVDVEKSESYTNRTSVSSAKDLPFIDKTETDGPDATYERDHLTSVGGMNAYCVTEGSFLKVD